jgi:molybdopterin synthase catalytic subunit
MANPEWIWEEGPLDAARHLQDWCGQMAIDYANGCWSVFAGQVRKDQKVGSSVSGLVYSAYNGMVEKQIQRWYEEALPEADIHVKIVHSLGFVETGSCSLLVFLASPHRKELLQLQTRLIEYLKYEIPVWKQEVLENGEKNWIEA